MRNMFQAMNDKIINGNLVITKEHDINFIVIINITLSCTEQQFKNID